MSDNEKSNKEKSYLSDNVVDMEGWAQMKYNKLEEVYRRTYSEDVRKKMERLGGVIMFNKRMNGLWRW